MYAKNSFSAKLLSVLLCIAMIFTFAPAASAKSSQADKDLLLATLSDIHYYSEALAGNKGEAFYTHMEGSNCVYDDLDAILDSTFAALENDAKKKGLKYVVITGDLTINGEYEGHIALAERLRAFEKESGLKVYVVNGNHDINNPLAASFVNDRKEAAKTVNAAEFAEIYADFGYNEAYHTFSEYDTGKAGALSYSINLKKEGYRLIMIDAGKYTADVTEDRVDEKETSGAIGEELLEWVLKEAKDAKANGQTPIAFTHWNMSGENYLHEYIMQGFVIDEGYILQEVFADAGINYVFSGHQHTSDIDITYSDAGEPLYSVITPSLTQYPFAYRETFFDKQADGSLKVTFEQKECDSFTPVISADTGNEYFTPYRVTTGFPKQYSTAIEYLMKIIKKGVGNIFLDIRAAGSIIGYLEETMELDIKQTISDFIYGGLSFSGYEVLTENTIMAFLQDIDKQVMDKYINNPDYTFAIIESAITNVVNTQISEVPSTKHIDTFGFGNKNSGGTIGDLLLSIVVSMYVGNEDFSDDKFMLDVLNSCNSVEFVNLVFDTAAQYVVKDVVIDEILANTDLHLDTLIDKDETDIATFIQVCYITITSIINSGIFDDLGTKKITMQEVTGFVTKLLSLIGGYSTDISLTNLVKIVLETGLIPYGSTVDELIDNLIAEFISEQDKMAAADQLYVLCDTICNDEDKDYNVTYTYKGKTKVTPTLEDMQLPSHVTVSVGENAADSFIISWYTKYSVTGSDIEIFEAGTSRFKGKATVNKNIKATSEETTLFNYCYDLGSFGVFNYERKVIKHSITVTGLKPGTAYSYRIGDAKKGFWSDKGTYTTADNSSGFSFIQVSNTAGATQKEYDIWAKTLNAALKTTPKAAFIVHTGDMTYNAATGEQWGLALNSVSDILTDTPLMYTSSDSDTAEFDIMTKYFNFGGNAPTQISEKGLYYSYDYNNAHFTVLNTNDLNKDGTLRTNQLKWLREDLNESKDAQWKIIVLHEPLYGNADSDSKLLAQLSAMIESYDIDLILQGHEAVYLRTEILLDNAKENTPVINKTINGKAYKTYVGAFGTLALTSGNAGVTKEVTVTENELFNKNVSTNAPMYTSYTINGNTLTVDVYTVDKNGKNTLYDSFAMVKAGNKIKLGDVDFDGRISAADARLALRCAVGLEENIAVAQTIAADTDADKKILSSDARTILRAAVGLEKISPATVEASREIIRETKFE